jgi:hypothetical protein
MNEIQAIIEDIRYLITRNKINEALILLETLQAWMDAKESVVNKPERQVFYIDLNGDNPNDIDKLLDMVRARIAKQHSSDKKNMFNDDKIKSIITDLFKNSGLGD